MERRKFVIGLGSLAAGGAAATGTGALSNFQGSRDASFSIAADNNAFLGLSASNSTLENGEHASVGGNNELSIHFNSNSSVGGSGLNPDGETWFDEVFQVTNQGTQPLDIMVDDDNLAQSENIVFYVDGSFLPDSGYDEGDLYAIEGYPGSAEGTGREDDDQHASGDGDGTDDYWVGYANPKLGAGSSIPVGIYVDTTGENTVGQWDSGSVTVKASTNLNQP